MVDVDFLPKTFARSHLQYIVCGLSYQATVQVLIMSLHHVGAGYGKVRAK